MQGLANLRRIRTEGGWEPLPTGATLRVDSVDVRVPLLRRRLAVEGDLTGPVDDANLQFEPSLAEAVKSFQNRHDLNADGVVGDATLAALNVPVERRIEQVRVNMERARWIGRELPDTFVAVNVAGAKVYLVHGNAAVFETRAVVGTEYRQTPVFTAPIRYIDLNPTWTVPASIVGEILRHVRDEPGYLEREGMRVLDRSGRAVDPSSIDFARYTAASFPYVFRQDPGPMNALGQIKLMLPNPYAVYLHDTPSRSLFAREERLFSHGCIRLEDPIGLATLVLDDPERWNRETLQAAIDTRVTQTISLSKPVPVYVLYWTAIANLRGELRFSSDVYGRDAAVLAKLDAGMGGGTRAGESK
jgi:murein L,D-transpeptidase YcbB/YkuD